MRVAPERVIVSDLLVDHVTDAELVPVETGDMGSTLSTLPVETSHDSVIPVEIIDPVERTGSCPPDELDSDASSRTTRGMRGRSGRRAGAGSLSHMNHTRKNIPDVRTNVVITARVMGEILDVDFGMIFLFI